jgi:hypothetical protein
MKKIFISRDKLVKGEYCYKIEDYDRDKNLVGEPYFIKGFECKGIVFIKSEGTHAWVEFHGDDEDFKEGGKFFKPTDEREKVMFNFFPKGQVKRLKEDETLKFGAVNRHRVLAGNPAAVTFYSAEGAALMPELRFEGVVRSVTITPPVLGDPEPLNSWIETNGLVEYH